MPDNQRVVSPFDEQNTENAAGQKLPPKGKKLASPGDVHKGGHPSIGDKPYGTHGTHSGG